jgi:DNA-binding NarL/FixJ family response regulator
VTEKRELPKQSEGPGAGNESCVFDPFLVSRGEAMLVTVPLPPGEPPVLTGAEAEVFDLLKEGLGNREIAERRRTSVRTAEKQVQQVFGKLGVSSRTELLREYG